MTRSLASRHPTATGLLLALVSLGLGVTALLAADFGAPPWLFALLLLWLGTLGLPTTLAVLVTASCWGRCSPCYGLGPFLFLASTFAILAQVSACRALARLNRKNA